MAATVAAPVVPAGSSGIAVGVFPATGSTPSGFARDRLPLSRRRRGRLHSRLSLHRRLRPLRHPRCRLRPFRHSHLRFRPRPGSHRCLRPATEFAARYRLRPRPASPFPALPFRLRHANDALTGFAVPVCPCRRLRDRHHHLGGSAPATGIAVSDITVSRQPVKPGPLLQASVSPCAVFQVPAEHQHIPAARPVPVVHRVQLASVQLLSSCARADIGVPFPTPLSLAVSCLRCILARARCGRVPSPLAVAELGLYRVLRSWPLPISRLARAFLCRPPYQAPAPHRSKKEKKVEEMVAE